MNTFDRKIDYAEYSDPEFASIYNVVNHLGDEKEFCIDFANKILAKSIIDIGCGSGLLTNELAKLGYTMTGVEPAQAMLDIAKKDLSADKVTWVQGYATDLPNVKSDLALMTNHVSQFILDNIEWQRSLKSIYECLNPGGFLIFDSSNPKNEPWKNKWPTENAPKIKFDDLGVEIKWWVNVLKLENSKVLYELHCVTSDDKKMTSLNQIIFRTIEEIRDDLINTGFDIRNIYGDWDKTQVKIDSNEYIFIAQKV